MNLPSQNFRPRVYGVGAWTDNLPFAYDLVALVRPKTLVELGVDRGESYFAFCQSVAENRTDTRCFGIDRWTGDEHVGSYDETTFREVSAHNAQHYATFSMLIRSGFDEALARFDGESIDLLHIDGSHTETAARHDVESWLPKLAPGGILLMHDVCVRERDFGVWKVWSELRERSRSFTFENGPGLGVWQKPPARELPQPIEELLAGSPTNLVRNYGDRAHVIHAQIAADWQTGAVRNNAIGNQTTVQVFYAAPFSEDKSLLARIGHNEWRTLRFRLPDDAGPSLRVDFVSPFSTIEIESISLDDVPIELERVRLAGDCQRESTNSGLRLRVTGIDPQLYLPELQRASRSANLSIKLRVHTATA